MWYSELLLSCFTLSFYPPSQHSPLGTLGSCHLEPSIVLTLLWISLFLLTSSLVPILYWAGSYSFSLQRPGGHHLLREAFFDPSSAAPTASLDLYKTLYTPQLYAILSVYAPGPSGWRPWSPSFVSHHPVLYLVCGRPLGNGGRINFSIKL